MTLIPASIALAVPSRARILSTLETLAIGSAEEVIEKILFQHEVFGHQRYLMQSVGPLPHEAMMRSIELFGTKLARAVRNPVVYEERDHSFYMGVTRTGDDKFVTIEEHSTLSSEIRFIPSNQPKAKFKVLAPREHDFEYHADHIGHRWIVRTNWNAKNFRVLEADDAHTGDKKRWHELMPGRDNVFISGVALFKDYLVVGERSDGLQRAMRARGNCRVRRSLRNP